jgi:rhodanese-related sulfurtransferase
VRVVVYDSGEADTENVALRAAQRLQALGYTDVHVLEGGTKAWKAAGYVLFAGVNLPSKTFGELVEHAYGTPRITAQQLAAKQASGEPLVVLDGRPVSEFHKMNIPGAVCCPNGELAYRIRSLVPDDSTPVVINCAGRTRSILGAQTLINLGISNPVYALENGTQGWFLNDLSLEHGGRSRYADDSGSGALQSQAQQLAQRFDVPGSLPRRSANGLRTTNAACFFAMCVHLRNRRRQPAWRPAHTGWSTGAGRRPIHRRARCTAGAF